MLPTIAKIFLILGAIFLLIGGLLFLASRFNIPLGKLPGDFTIQTKGFICVFPLATSILISIILSILLTLISLLLGRK